MGIERFIQQYELEGLYYIFHNSINILHEY